MFLPYFSVFNIFIHIRQKGKIPDSYDKCEPGFYISLTLKFEVTFEITELYISGIFDKFIYVQQFH